jgi:hypothetical protein
MKKKPQDQRDWHERRIEETRKKHLAPEPTKQGAKGKPVKGGAPESPESRETFEQRTKKPGDAGLANEARPGLGSRADYADPAVIPTEPPKEAKSRSKPEATKHSYEEPRPEPREQPSDSMAHEQERSTGVSGHSGNT